jgi:ubiquinone/menaquinone biosynthesis C-methylase UbiE
VSKIVLTDYEPFWDEMAHTEEVDYDDEMINRLLRFKAIQNHLPGVRKILDVGAATGAFSIPLARMGFDVIHLDLSDEMITIAKYKAADLTNIRFVKQDAACLEMFEDNEFDLVLCFDGAISFSGHKAGNVISEICRVGKKVMLSVSSKSCMTATWLNYCLTKLNRIHPSVKDMMETGYFSKDDYDDAEELTSISELKAYDVDELRDVLHKNGMNVLECHSIGSLTHLYLLHLYRQNTAEGVYDKINAISTDKDFIEICDYYDKFVMPNGMGSFRRAGIFAVAEKS